MYICLNSVRFQEFPTEENLKTGRDICYFIMVISGLAIFVTDIFIVHYIVEELFFITITEKWGEINIFVLSLQQRTRPLETMWGPVTVCPAHEILFPRQVILTILFHITHPWSLTLLTNLQERSYWKLKSVLKCSSPVHRPRPLPAFMACSNKILCLHNLIY